MRYAFTTCRLENDTKLCLVSQFGREDTQTMVTKFKLMQLIKEQRSEFISKPWCKANN